MMLHITVEADCGQTIYSAIAEASEIARQRDGDRVTLRFNDTEILVKPACSAQELFHAWWIQRPDYVRP